MQKGKKQTNKLFVYDSLHEEKHFGMETYPTSSLDSHPHLRGAHAATLIRVSLFVNVLTQTPAG